MTMALSKTAPRGERARIEELIAKQEARVRRAFRRFLEDVQSTAVRRQVRIALEESGVGAALQVIDAHVTRVGSVLLQVFQDSGTAEAEALGRQLGGSRAGIVVAFDPSDPRAAALMRANRLAFVQEFGRAQRDATREALQEALKTGAGPIQTARMFRDSIGLTLAQRRAVASYRRSLELMDSSSLDRELRDRRFDSSVARSVKEEEPLGAKRIQRMVERYRMRYVQLRAETIARTETQSMVSQARYEALLQISEQTGLDSTRIKRQWVSTKDRRVRDTHAAMDGQLRGLNEPFVSPFGARLMYPGDRSLGAPASEVVNCRCSLITRITRA